MKKAFQILSVSLVVVLCLGLGAACIFLGRQKPFSSSYNLTAGLDAGLSMRQISVEYEKACVAVVCEGPYDTSLGSGVCVASIDSETESGYKVKTGSYFVTNYHVIKKAVDKDFASQNFEISIVLDDGAYTSYPATILWSSRECDMAILFSEMRMDGYVEMEDRWIDCEDQRKLKRNDVFTMGTPLDISYLNTYSEGYVSNSKSMISASVKDFYYRISGSTITGSANKLDVSSLSSVEVTENIYSDLIMLNLDITHGNSGGGLFDSEGKLIGLTTLGLDVSDTNGASMNFAVPIYPVTLILDKLIENNENKAQHKIYTIQNLGLSVFDAETAAFAKLIQEDQNAKFYYVEGQIISLSERDKLNFQNQGVYIYSNNGSFISNLSVSAGAAIIGATKGGEKFEIQNRNDFIYFLLKCSKGDKFDLTLSTDRGDTLAKNIVLA